MDRDVMKAYVEAATAVLDPPIAPGHMPGVLLNFEFLGGAAELVNGFEPDVPVVAVPVSHQGAMPIGVQFIARPWHEADALRVAAWLESNGVVQAPVVNP